MCYTETGIRIYHNILATSVLYHNAIGTVSSLRSRLLPSGASRALLCYSLVVRHPVFQVSTRSCGRTIVNRTLSFGNNPIFIGNYIRRAEGLIYGFSNLVKLHSDVIDHSRLLLINLLCNKLITKGVFCFSISMGLSRRQC